jgi:hypothetical protein
VYTLPHDGSNDLRGICLYHAVANPTQMQDEASNRGYSRHSWVENPRCTHDGCNALRGICLCL